MPLNQSDSSFSSILIVEDDLFQSKILSSIIASLTDAEVHCAQNGKDALSLIHQIKPDIVFCDLIMPQMDGVEFTRQLAAFDPTAIVVFISSAAQDVQRAVVEMAKSAGLMHVNNLEKPITRSQISDVLHWAQAQCRHTHNTYSQSVFISDEEIRNAVTANEFEPFYQAHFHSETNELVGAEALIRWRHPKHGYLAPALFLDRLFELGLSYPICCQMIRSAVETANLWHQAGWYLNISVNVTPSDLAQSDFSQRVLTILEQARFPASKLTLEVTEIELSPDVVSSLESSSRLRMHGVSISIDDFGTGHSSLTQLISSPFTELKIDQTFVADMLESTKHMAAVKCVIDLSKNLGLTVVAEGVETLAQAKQLTIMGCDILQGYALAKPLPNHDFIQLCENRLTPSDRGLAQPLPI